MPEDTVRVVIYRRILYACRLAESIRLLNVESVLYCTSHGLLATLTDKLEEGEDGGECVESAVYCSEDPAHVLATSLRH